MTQITNAGKSQQSSYIHENLTALVRLFNNLDQAAAKIAHLKANVRREEQAIGQMETWLKKYQQQLLGPFSATKPPALSATKQLAEKNAEAQPSSLGGTAHKLTIARRYLEDQFRHTKDQPQYPGGEPSYIPKPSPKSRAKRAK